ncbi:heavy metal translocating P-type ATPase [Butyrivibrio proteoclasticus B316]|uniref:Cd(2+)-exporting ATPase n=1 Tax=Butyrivibrio proteoclasticus (strain ATCC 51982 / DSM 14932 / B316) TaxID=515622 RepID=E0RUZ6_BUTPB|nr:heavy metal translocating P-type ATPase [Butyrivibrio proteoclasticus]ADL34266.1 heavy metal translocating P-type ATPase [Butyrivibrio proteoclasticus B316]
MTKKQKKNRNRIIAVLVIFAVLLILDKTGILEPLPWFVVFAIYVVPYIIIGYDVIKKAAINISHGQVFDENFLMMIATFGAFGIQEYSEALAVMLFYQIGELFQSVAVGKSRQSITELMSIAPESANLLDEEGNVSEVDPEEVSVGDLLLVRAGEKIPVDGSVIEGESFIDTAALTGESVPRKVAPGDSVISGCVNGEGILKVRVEKAYEDSTVSKILELVENASNKKSRMENFITRFARYYTPIVTIGALLLAVIPGVTGALAWSDSIRRACIFLIVSCPCALVISVPLGFFGGIGASSKLGVLVKGSNYLESVSKVNTVVFDKTGTITKGEFKVTETFVDPEAGINEAQLLKMAAHGESLSNHPIARSICQAYQEGMYQNAPQSLDNSLIDNTQTKEVSGHGIASVYEGKELLLGNAALLTDYGISFSQLDNAGTIVYVGYDGKYLGAVVISDVIKETAKDAIRALKESGVKNTVMLTGDREKAARDVAQKVGVDQVIAELLPADKVSRVEKMLSSLDNDNKLAFVGDGINDAPVLMRADVGIAMGSLGSDAAIEAADVVIMDDDISKIASVIAIARKTMRIVKENIVFALGVKLIILVLGALGLTTMWLAVFGDVGVAVIAILNSMRALKYEKK